MIFLYKIKWINKPLFLKKSVAFPSFEIGFKKLVLFIILFYFYLQDKNIFKEGMILSGHKKILLR